MLTYLSIYSLLWEQTLRFLRLQPAEIRLFPVGLTPTLIHAAARPRGRRRSSKTTFLCFSLVFATPPGLCECVALERGGDHRGLIPGLNYLSAPSVQGRANGGQEGLASRAGSSSPLQSHAVDVEAEPKSDHTNGGGGRTQSRGEKQLRGSDGNSAAVAFLHK